jgi:hypothetical protein
VSVYFISARDVDLVKIGCAFDPVRRFNHLRTASPIELTLEGAIPGGYAKEHELHERFAKQRVRGEWFMITAEIQTEIDASTRPEKFTWASVRKWVEALARQTGPEAMVHRVVPIKATIDREQRAFDKQLAKALGRRSTHLEKLEAAGEIHFPFRRPAAAHNESCAA